MGGLGILHPHEHFLFDVFFHLCCHCILPQPPYFHVLVLWVTILHTPSALEVVSYPITLFSPSLSRLCHFSESLADVEAAPPTRRGQGTLD